MARWSPQALLPLLGVALAAIAWGFATEHWQIAASVLPGPGDVGRALYRGWILGELHSHILFTLTASLLGVLIGCSTGLVLGILVGESQQANRFFYPVLAGSQSMPMIAIAPLLMVWWGLGIASKIALVALSCLAPMFVIPSPASVPSIRR